MDALILALFVITVASHATAISCNVSGQATVPCYAVEGEPVHIDLNINVRDLDTKLVKGHDAVLKLKKNLTIAGGYRNRVTLSSEGILKLYKVSQHDSGNYKFEIYNLSSGNVICNPKFQLILQGRLSKPTLDLLCLPHGEMRASCSSHEEYNELTWTLGDHSLNGSVAYLSSQNNTVILKDKVAGNLTCLVRNHVSTNITMHYIVPCPGLAPPVSCVLPNGTEVLVRMNLTESPSTITNTEIVVSFIDGQTLAMLCQKIEYGNYVFAFGLAFAVLVLLNLLGIYCLYPMPEKTHNAGAENDSTELVYAKVHIRRKKVRQEQIRMDSEFAEYGEVRVPESYEHTVDQQECQEPAIYTVVQLRKQPMKQ